MGTCGRKLVNTSPQHSAGPEPARIANLGWRENEGGLCFGEGEYARAEAKEGHGGKAEGREQDSGGSKFEENAFSDALGTKFRYDLLNTCGPLPRSPASSPP